MGGLKLQGPQQLNYTSDIVLETDWVQIQDKCQPRYNDLRNLRAFHAIPPIIIRPLSNDNTLLFHEYNCLCIIRPWTVYMKFKIYLAGKTYCEMLGPLLYVYTWKFLEYQAWSFYCQPLTFLQGLTLLVVKNVTLTFLACISSFSAFPECCFGINHRDGLCSHHGGSTSCDEFKS